MPIRRHSIACIVLGAMLILGVPSLAGAQTLKAVQERGALNCGVSQGLPGFSEKDASGAWSGFDVDFCRAIAAAIFNDAGKVNFVPLNAVERWDAIKSGKIDVLSRNSTWTLSREVELALVFAGVTYYDGQGFLVRRARNVTSALELGGTKICVQTGTTTELNLGDFFSANGMKFELVSLQTATEVVKAYNDGRCDVFSSDVSQLYAERLNLTKPAEHMILADIISKEPLGPAVRRGDEQWLNIVKWVHFAMINAEELGVGMKTLEEALKSEKPDVKRLLGRDNDYGKLLGLTNDWAARVIRLVGNYSEVFERNVGTRSRVGIPRGLNHLWSAGGIQYAPPIR
jgi:general L-amino acid transport system substrate-binding protein